MSKKLFSFKSAEEAHAKLEELLNQKRAAQGHLTYGTPTVPLAECRVYPNDPEPYQFWDEPAPPNTREADPKPEPLKPSDLDHLADLVVKKLLEKGAKP